MLTEHSIDYSYRDYRQDRLSQEEIRETLSLLGIGPREVLRENDPVAKQLGLPGEEGDDVLVALMAEHPTLLQRPIGIYEGRAIVGRPPERLLDLLGIETE